MRTGKPAFSDAAFDLKSNGNSPCDDRRQFQIGGAESFHYRWSCMAWNWLKNHEAAERFLSAKIWA
jgi:hypothetical protein